MARRRLYYKSDSIEGPFISKGEFINRDGSEYSGVYVKNGDQYFTGQRITDNSVEIFFPPENPDPSVEMYNELADKEWKIRNAPDFHYPTPSDQDYQEGFMVRYFVQRVNDPRRLYEISKEQFQSIGSDSGLDENLWKSLQFEWILDPFVAEKENIKVLNAADRKLPGVYDYLSDPREFSR